jgi:predicted alpha/beta superfamily hydrolase
MRAQCVLAALCCLAFGSTHAADEAAPLVIGETFTLQSKVLSETRRINVYLPPGYAEAPDARFPVLYMPDGGLAEDFLHVAGLVQVSVGNGTMRPCVLVGIENTQRRRDLTGPTQNEEDKKIAPRVGGSAAFRRFLRDELMPDVKARYRTTDETGIVGESLAGLFVIETFLLEPDLFDTSERLFAVLQSGTSAKGLLWRFERFPEEKHATIYHPAALMAFRAVFGPR